MNEHDSAAATADSAGVHSEQMAEVMAAGVSADPLRGYVDRSRAQGKSRFSLLDHRSVSVSSDGVARTVTIPAWWTREGQPQMWVDGQIGPGGQYAAGRVWPPDPQLLIGSACGREADTTTAMTSTATTEKEG